MPRYAMTIAYNGSNYSGWQVQPNAITIQEVLEKALKTYLKVKTAIYGSGRTDQGVHAYGQVAHFNTEKELNVERALQSLNGLLPLEIRILKIKKVSDAFHARYSAKKKIYHYHLWLDPIKDPILFPYRLHVIKPMDVELLKKAAKKLMGTHNFMSFANRRGGGFSTNNPIKTIYRIDLVRQRGGYRVEFEGNGFLYKMVRNLMGVMLKVAQNKMTLLEIDKLLSKQDRRQAPMPAPAHPLYLMKVIY